MSLILGSLNYILERKTENKPINIIWSQGKKINEAWLGDREWLESEESGAPLGRWHLRRHLNEVSESFRQRSGEEEKRTTEVTESVQILRQESQCDYSEASKGTMVGDEVEETDLGWSCLIPVSKAFALHLIVTKNHWRVLHWELYS